jgi:hypothetical protein
MLLWLIQHTCLNTTSLPTAYKYLLLNTPALSVLFPTWKVYIHMKAPQSIFHYKYSLRYVRSKCSHIFPDKEYRWWNRKSNKLSKTLSFTLLSCKNYGSILLYLQYWQQMVWYNVTQNTRISSHCDIVLFFLCWHETSKTLISGQNSNEAINLRNLHFRDEMTYYRDLTS